MSGRGLRVLSLDVASRTGWAVGDARSIDTRSIESGVFKTPKRPILGERLLAFRTTLVELIDFYQPGLIAYEQPYDPPPPDPAKPRRIPYNRTTDKFLQKLEAVVELTATERAIPYENYRSQEWRMTALGMGRAPKGSPEGELKRMMVRKARALGYAIASDDEADALGILLHALTGAPAVARSQPDLLDIA